MPDTFFHKERIGSKLEDYWIKSPEADLEKVWSLRYKQEAKIILNYPFESVLEIGSGPGMLAQEIIEKRPDISYELVDVLSAKKIFEERKYLGEFIPKDLENSFDTSNLMELYDMIIMNDFLEHVRNPSIIISKLRNLMDKESHLFVSVPNWRMGHAFIYPGLFDFDNFVAFIWRHKYKIKEVYNSIIRCHFSKKLECESKMPEDSLIDSWNWYFVLQNDI